jgi:hypothetical protein
MAIEIVRADGIVMDDPKFDEIGVKINTAEWAYKRFHNSEWPYIHYYGADLARDFRETFDYAKAAKSRIQALENLVKELEYEIEAKS